MIVLLFKVFLSRMAQCRGPLIDTKNTAANTITEIVMFYECVGVYFYLKQGLSEGGSHPSPKSEATALIG